MRLLLMFVLAFATAGAHAATYGAKPGSTLGFTATYMDEEFEGRFAAFTPDIRFDPDDLANSRFDVIIDLSSADTQNQERDEMLVGSEFFDAAAQKQARYVATAFRALGGNRFVAQGRLTLRGASHAVPLTFTWTPGANPVLVGEATLSRLAFNVGIGDWTDTGLLPDVVKVRTRLVLAPKAD